MSQKTGDECTFRQRDLKGGDQGRAQRGAGKLDPTQGVVKDKAERGTGFIAWTEDDLAKYRERWPLGTRQRLAVEVMVNLGLRRSDACRIGPNDFKGGRLTDFEPQKTKGTTGVKLTLPIHPELAEAIAAMTVVGTKTFLVQEARGRKGQPFKNGESGGAWMREQCDAAGLHQPRLAQGGGDPPGAGRLYRTRTVQGVRLYAGTGAGLC